MATSKVILHPRTKADGTRLIIIRITEDRKHKSHSTGYSVKESQFREGLEGWVIKHPDSALLNMAIEAQRSRLMEAYYRKDIEGAPAKVTGTFLEAARKKQTFYELRGNVGAYYKTKALVKNLNDFWGRDIQVRQLNASHVEEYIKGIKSRGGSNNSLKKDLANLAIIFDSVSSGKNPFREAAKSLKYEQTEVKGLSREELQLLAEVELTGMNDIARDMFLFSYYTHGMRFQNVLTSEPSKDDHLRYRMNKGKKIREIEIHPKLKALLKKYPNKPYIFPLITEKISDPWKLRQTVGAKNALVNAHLKRVAIISGLEPINFHQARHTFARHMLDGGVSLEVLKDALGHSNFNTTQRYAQSLSDKRINEVIRGLY